MKKPLTKKQRIVFNFIVDYIAKNKCSPTYIDISFGTSCGIASVIKLVKKLEERGYITRDRTTRPPEIIIKV